MRDAATRVFSNAAGSYSANVGLTIENGPSIGWLVGGWVDGWVGWLAGWLVG